jgi:WD40 repeat protein
LALSPDGKTVAAAGGRSGYEGEVKLWDIATGKLVADLNGHDGWVECVAFSPDGKVLVSAGGFWQGPGEIKLWDLSSRGIALMGP